MQTVGWVVATSVQLSFTETTPHLTRWYEADTHQHNFILPHLTPISPTTSFTMNRSQAPKIVGASYTYITVTVIRDFQLFSCKVATPGYFYITDNYVDVWANVMHKNTRNNNNNNNNRNEIVPNCFRLMSWLSFRLYRI